MNTSKHTRMATSLLLLMFVLTMSVSGVRNRGDQSTIQQSLDAQRQKVQNKTLNSSKAAETPVDTVSEWSIQSYIGKANEYVNWESMKSTMSEQKDIILYCICIIILTSILLVLFMAFKSKFYTNKFDKKELFTARKLFRPHHNHLDRMKNKHKEVLNVIKEDENESYDVESFR